MDDLSLEDDEKEEEAQHDVAQVAEDVVERTARDGGSQGTFSFFCPASHEQSWSLGVNG